MFRDVEEVKNIEISSQQQKLISNERQLQALENI